MKFVKGPGYETYNTIQVEKKHKENSKEAKEPGKTQEEVEVEEAPVPVVTHAKNILHLVFAIVEVYVNNQNFYNSNGL